MLIKSHFKKQKWISVTTSIYVFEKKKNDNVIIINNNKGYISINIYEKLGYIPAYYAENVWKIIQL